MVKMNGTSVRDLIEPSP